MCFLCSYAEQLVLYLKIAELLSSGLQTAIDQIKAGKLCLSSTVKQGKGSWAQVRGPELGVSMLSHPKATRLHCPETWAVRARQSQGRLRSRVLSLPC